MNEKPWYVWFGNTNNPPYLVGEKRAIAVDTTSARKFATKKEAEEYIRSRGTTAFPGMGAMIPVQAD